MPFATDALVYPLPLDHPLAKWRRGFSPTGARKTSSMIKHSGHIVSTSPCPRTNPLRSHLPAGRQLARPVQNSGYGKPIIGPLGTDFSRRDWDFPYWIWRLWRVDRVPAPRKGGGENGNCIQSPLTSCRTVTFFAPACAARQWRKTRPATRLDSCISRIFGRGGPARGGVGGESTGPFVPFRNVVPPAAIACCHALGLQSLDLVWLVVAFMFCVGEGR